MKLKIQINIFIYKYKYTHTHTHIHMLDSPDIEAPWNWVFPNQTGATNLTYSRNRKFTHVKAGRACR